VREFREEECLMMVTRRGTVKKTELTAFRRPLAWFACERQFAWSVPFQLNVSGQEAMSR
jgi:hypothetical protein